MNLTEAKEILNNNGYLVESVNKEEVFDFFYDLKRELEQLDYKVSSVYPDYRKKYAGWENTFYIKKYGATIDFSLIFRSKLNEPEIFTFYKLKDDMFTKERNSFDYEDNCDKIVKYVEEIFNTDEEILQIKKENEGKPEIKYTNLRNYKSDIYDELTARGLNSEFAMDYVNGLDVDFMKDHQDIKALADEAVREWG